MTVSQLFLGSWTPRRMPVDRAPHRVLYIVAALLFVLSATLTIVWCASMSTMGMPMPGGWTMSMAWMVMPGQTWIGAAASFLVMWMVMMVAMMLPSLVPMLRRYREAVQTVPELQLDGLTAIVAVAYFLVWTAIGLVVFPAGLALAELEMQLPALSRAVPMAAGVVVLIAGSLQFTAWKAHHLACCREEPGPGHDLMLAATLRAAWHHGLRLGVHCSYCCAGLMAILLVLGVMDLRAMAAVTALITAERVAPAGERVMRLTGVVIIGASLVLIAQAVL